MTDTHASDSKAIDTLRFLSIDMVEQAKSGHPGAPMGQAAMAYWLWTRYLRFDPADPEWPNRDRFVLSCGHASALIYSLLHLAGYDLPLDELKRFRQLGSATPGHPEYGHTPGVETTTGPLGQGLATAVGMAMARRHLASTFNREDFSIFDHHVWVLASDGDLMEGVASEASSLAGHLKLGGLTVLWDDNRITIDGGTDLAFAEDVVARYRAYGWHTLEVDDGNDLGALDAAMAEAREIDDRPTLVRVRTHIGFGSPNKQDTSGVHGSPLGADERRLTKEAAGWPLEPTFHIPDEARQAFGEARQRGQAAHRAWDELVTQYTAVHPGASAELAARRAGQLGEGWQEAVPSFSVDDGSIATRKASGKVLGALAARIPQLMGGSADLAPSNNTFLAGEAVFSPDGAGRNLHFGVREHAMGAVMNGMALSGLLRPYGGTFLIFSDYMRPAIRLAALMGLPCIYVMTHDSIFLGEDGPTHQPISQLLSMRAIPGLTVFRPADANETAQAWRLALDKGDGPTLLALTRQGLPVLPGTVEGAAEGVARGGYVVSDCVGEPRVLLLASGSEVALAVKAQTALAERGIAARVVSLPCWSLFDQQDAAYRDQVLPPGVTARLALEAGSPLGWHRYVGPAGDVLAIEGYGASAPAAQLAEHYGFTTEEVVRRAEALIA